MSDHFLAGEAFTVSDHFSMILITDPIPISGMGFAST